MSASAVGRMLRQRGLVLVDASAQSTPNATTRPVAYQRRATRRQSVLELTRALGALLPAGLPLSRALAATTGLVSSALAGVLADVRTHVERGDAFADAVSHHRAWFSPLYVGVVRAGERSGDLAGALNRLGDQLEREEALRAKLLAASIYPLILAIAGGSAIVVLLTFVLPRFADLLSGVGVALPASTALLLNASSIARRFWPVLLGGTFALAAVLGVARTTAAGRDGVSKALLALPLIGGLRTQALAARFARLTGVLLAGGAPLLTALHDTAESIADPLTRADAVRIRARVREGASLTTAITESTIFPPLLAQLVAVGEESGKLAPFLLKAADIFEDRADRTRQRLVALAEPGMIVLFGGIIGFVALSLLQAIYGVNVNSFR
jgi:general secretion pathway protein F